MDGRVVSRQSCLPCHGQTAAKLYCHTCPCMKRHQNSLSLWKIMAPKSGGAKVAPKAAAPKAAAPKGTPSTAQPEEAEKQDFKWALLFPSLLSLSAMIILIVDVLLGHKHSVIMVNAGEAHGTIRLNITPEYSVANFDNLSLRFCIAVCVVLARRVPGLCFAWSSPQQGIQWRRCARHVRRDAWTSSSTIWPAKASKTTS